MYKTVVSFPESQHGNNREKVATTINYYCSLAVNRIKHYGSLVVNEIKHYCSLVVNGIKQYGSLVVNGIKNGCSYPSHGECSIYL
jgi:hypothetical protein